MFAARPPPVMCENALTCVAGRERSPGSPSCRSWLARAVPRRGCAEFRDVAVQRPSGVREQHMAGERVTVAVQPGGAHRDRDITRLHTVRARTSSASTTAVPAPATSYSSGSKPGCSAVAAEQCASRLNAAVGDACNDRGDAFRDDLAGRDVVRREERLSACHHEVVDHHRYEVDANRVVLCPLYCATATLRRRRRWMSRAAGGGTSRSLTRRRARRNHRRPHGLRSGRFGNRMSSSNSTARSPAAVSTPAA